MLILTENLYFFGAGRTVDFCFPLLLLSYYLRLGRSLSYYLRLGRRVHIHWGAIFKLTPFSLIQAGGCHGTNLSSPYSNLFLR